MNTQLNAMKRALEAWQTSVYGSESHHKAMLLAMTNMGRALEQQPADEPVAWAKKAMELATDFAIESLRVGSYERKDTYERTGLASYQTVELRAKREAARERLRQHLYTHPAPVQEPEWKWLDAPVKTLWGDDMVVADLAIDKDHTVSVYCERDQTAKVEALLAPPAAQRQSGDNK